MAIGRAIRVKSGKRHDTTLRCLRLLAWMALASGSFTFHPPSASAADLDAAFAPWGFDLSGRNPAITPGDDFFGYADGAAVGRIAIPADHSAWGSFNILAELSRSRVGDILQGLAAHPVADPQTVEEKLGAFYAGFLDEKRVEALGTAPLQPDLAAIRAVTDRTRLATLLGQAQDGYGYSLFGLSVAPDASDPTRSAIQLDQGGTGLPDRDYYLRPEFAAKKDAYRAYVARMLELAGWPDPVGSAAAILRFETALAQVQWTRADIRDPVRTYNPLTVAALVTQVPQFDWRAFFGAAALPRDGTVVVTENSAVLAEARLAAATDLATLRAWLAFHLVDNAAGELPARFVAASFDFHGRTLSGQPQLEPRAKRAVTATTAAMGMAVGRAYVARWFPPERKRQMQVLTAELKAVFRARLARNPWMDPATRQAAIAKLDNQLILIGYPDTWRDYAGLVVRPGDLYGNTERATAFDWAWQRGHLGRPVDRSEWDMTPQTVNAYNAPHFDEVVFPAAILQPPFFNPDADAAINYGAIGGVIGHEMTHSFDDQGRRFDRLGRLHDWWTADDARRFQARADRLGAQFDALTPFPGLHVNGRLTMGDNIADLGGLTLALDAYHAHLHGAPAPVIDGLTGDQRVFLGWAQIWRQKVRDDRARMLLVTDPHSPVRARVDMPMHNLDGWYRAWAVKPGDALYLPPDARVQIW